MTEKKKLDSSPNLYYSSFIDKGVGELQLMRKDLDGHLKTKYPKIGYECQHCGEKGTYASVTEDHDKVCNKKIVPCPN